VSIVSLKLDTSGVAYRILTATVQASPLLRALIIGEPTSEVLTLRHPNGLSVEIACVAGAKAGAGLVARWSAGVVFDEAPRMVGADDGIVNLDDAVHALLGRLLPGAQALYIGSPWAPFGPVYDMVTERWGSPTDAQVVLRGTGPMLNPYWWTPERCAALRERDPVAYRTDVMGEFADPESSMFSSALIEGATRAEPAELEPNPLWSYSAAMDPATRGNSWTLVIATCTGTEGLIRKYSIALAVQWTGSKLSPLSPEAVLGEIAAVCRRYGLEVVWTDQWAADALRDLANRVGLAVMEERVTEQRKLEMYEALKLRLESGELELPPVPQVREDLLKVRKRITQTGASIVLPRTSDGRHADYAPALALALSQPIGEPQELPTPVDEMAEHRRARIREIERKRRNDLAAAARGSRAAIARLMGWEDDR
jgi:hypothetical protein